MKLTRIFNELRYGTLKGQAISREGGSVEEIDYPRLVTAVNSAMLVIYGRFKLKYNEALIRLIVGKYTYELHSDFAEANTESTQPVRWIVDSEESPFLDDLVRIHGVTADDGSTLTINDASDCMTAMTPTYNTIQLPPEVVDVLTSVSIVYEASPVALDASSTIAPEVTEVRIPEAMLEALCYYAASKFMESATGQDKSAKAQEFLAKYELACMKLQEYGMVNVDHTSNTNVGMNQWP
jgi:hypothetical protein